MNNTSQLRSAVEQQLTRGCLNEAGNMLWRPSCASSNCTKASRYGPWRYLGLQDASVRDCDQPNGTHCDTPTAEWGLLQYIDTRDSPACSLVSAQRYGERGSLIDSDASSSSEYYVSNCAKTGGETEEWEQQRVCEDNKSKPCRVAADCGGAKCIRLTSGQGVERQAQAFYNTNIYKGCLKSKSRVKSGLNAALSPQMAWTWAGGLAPVAFGVGALFGSDEKDTDSRLYYYRRKLDSYLQNTEIRNNMRACCLGDGAFQQKRRPLGAACNEDTDCVQTTAEGAATDVVCARAPCVEHSDCPGTSVCDKSGVGAPFLGPSKSYCLEKKCVRDGKAMYNKGCRDHNDCPGTFSCERVECQIHANGPKDGRVASDTGDEVSRRLAIPSKQTPSADPSTWGADYQNHYQTGPEGCGYESRTFWNPVGWFTKAGGQTALDAQPCVRSVGVCRAPEGGHITGICKRRSAAEYKYNLSSDQCPSAVPGLQLTQSYLLDGVAGQYGHKKYGFCPMISNKAGNLSNAMPGDYPNAFNEVDAAGGADIKVCARWWAPMHGSSAYLQSVDIEKWNRDCGPIYEDYCNEDVLIAAATSSSATSSAAPAPYGEDKVFPLLYYTSIPSDSKCAGGKWFCESLPGDSGTHSCKEGTTFNASRQVCERPSDSDDACVAGENAACRYLKDHELLVPTVRADVFKKHFPDTQPDKWIIDGKGQLNISANDQIYAKNFNDVLGEKPLALQKFMGMTDSRFIRFIGSDQIDNTGLIAPTCEGGDDCDYSANQPMLLAKHQGTDMETLFEKYRGDHAPNDLGVQFPFAPQQYLRFRVERIMPEPTFEHSFAPTALKEGYGKTPTMYRFSRVKLYDVEPNIKTQDSCEKQSELSGIKHIYDADRVECLRPFSIPHSMRNDIVATTLDTDAIVCQKKGGTYENKKCLAPPACIPKCEQRVRDDGTLDCDGQQGCTLNLTNTKCVPMYRPFLECDAARVGSKCDLGKCLRPSGVSESKSSLQGQCEKSETPCSASPQDYDANCSEKVGCLLDKQNSKCVWPNPLADKKSEQECERIEGATYSEGSCVFTAGHAYCDLSLEPCKDDFTCAQGEGQCKIAREKRNRGVMCVKTHGCDDGDSCDLLPQPSSHCELDPRQRCTSDSDCHADSNFYCERSWSDLSSTGYMPPDAWGTKRCMEATNWVLCSSNDVAGCETGIQHCQKLNDGVQNYLRYGIALGETPSIQGQAPPKMAMVTPIPPQDKYVKRWQAGPAQNGDVCRSYMRGRLADNSDSPNVPLAQQQVSCSFSNNN